MNRCPSSRSNRKRRLAVLRRLRFCCPLACEPTGGDSEDADSLWRPVGEEGLADDPFLWDGSPEAAVVTCPTVVAHHKKVPRRNLYGFREIAGSRCARPDIALLLELAVDDCAPV